MHVIQVLHDPTKNRSSPPIAYAISTLLTWYTQRGEKYRLYLLLLSLIRASSGSSHDILDTRIVSTLVSLSDTLLSLEIAHTGEGGPGPFSPFRRFAECENWHMSQHVCI